MHIYKIMFVEDTFTQEEQSKYNYDIIEVTEYGTKEISSRSIRHLEDDTDLDRLQDLVHDLDIDIEYV